MAGPINKSNIFDPKNFEFILNNCLSGTLNNQDVCIFVRTSKEAYDDQLAMVKKLTDLNEKGFAELNDWKGKFISADEKLKVMEFDLEQVNSEKRDSERLNKKLREEIKSIQEEKQKLEEKIKSDENASKRLRLGRLDTYSYFLKLIKSSFKMLSITLPAKSKKAKDEDFELYQLRNLDNHLIKLRTYVDKK